MFGAQKTDLSVGFRGYILTMDLTCKVVQIIEWLTRWRKNWNLRCEFQLPFVVSLIWPVPDIRDGGTDYAHFSVLLQQLFWGKLGLAMACRKLHFWVCSVTNQMNRRFIAGYSIMKQQGSRVSCLLCMWSKTFKLTPKTNWNRHFDFIICYIHMAVLKAKKE